ncbi:MAG: DUF5680 domain-containing protein, partial [Ferroplasma sp.]
MDDKDFRNFLLNAKRRSYAGGTKYLAGEIEGSKVFLFSNDGYSYRDWSIGLELFAGQETVTKDDMPVWSCVYSGGLTEEGVDAGEVYQFLKKCLSQPDSAIPVRGKTDFSNGN